MKNQINFLINYLTNNRVNNNIAVQNRAFNSQNNKRNFQTSRNTQQNFLKPPMRCFNCNDTGHIQRFCPKKNTTRGYQIKNSNFRQIRENPIDSNSNHSDENKSTDNDEADFFLVTTKSNNVNIRPSLTTGSFKYNNNNIVKEQHAVIKKHKVGKSTTFAKKSGSCYFSYKDALVDAWANYIDGKTGKPKPSKTVITNANSEFAANKPIVRGRINGKLGKIFIDSGAEINLIDSQTAKKIAPKTPISDEKFIIKCASNTTMKSKGSIELKLNIGDKISTQKFVIVDVLFPRVIVGIKTMKNIGLQIDPENDGIKINGKLISFLSKVEAVN